ncbi:MAG: mechanosensitive ion channel domain-containing protein [Bacteroidota bacterium]
MHIKHFSFLLTLTFLLVSNVVRGQGVIPQTTQEETPQTTTDSLRIRPFESTAITEAFSASNSLISESGQSHLSGEVIAGYVSEIDTLFSTIHQFLADSTVITLQDVSIRELESITQRAASYRGTLDQLQDRLAKGAVDLEEVVGRLDQNKARWQLTLQSIPEEEMIDTRLDRIDNIVHRIDSVRELLSTDLATMLGEQDRLIDRGGELEQLQSRVRDAKIALGESLFSAEMPGFFRDLKHLGDSTLVSKHVDQFTKSVKTDFQILKAEYAAPMIAVTIILVLLLIFAVWYSRHFARVISTEEFEISEMQKTLVNSPVVTILFVVALMVRFIFSDLPHTFTALNLVIMMVPMMIIVVRLFGGVLRTWILVLVILYSATFLFELAYFPDILLRIVLMIFSITGLWLFVWLIVKKPLESKLANPAMQRIYRLLVLVFTVLLFLAVIANLAGAFRLAEFFTLLPIQIAVLAIGIQVATKVADALVFFFLASNYVQKANVIREEFEVIYKKVVWLIDLFLWLFFFTTALRIFRLKDALFEWGRGLLTDGLKLGAVDITLGNILIFIFVIWLSIMITRILSHILEKDVFTRVKTEKGVPSTIILLLRIVLISGGFFLAAKAAGMALTNLSIVLGAFSVGIGFGLQNIFNNMVSGLILAFERPIKVGDVVEVGSVLGTVKSIGLRSSTVRSFDGAEVIVPNGNLISDQMTNWTLSDSTRRVEILIGVAYGTDPEVVLAILKEIASEHEMVRKVPFPSAYFTGFGDSSLDFRLLVWTHVDNILVVASELNTNLNKALNKAGIEIPFPQTDLHVRSDDTKPKPAAAKAKK